MAGEIVITVPKAGGGAVERRLKQGATGLDAAAAISGALARQALAARVDGRLVDLTAPLADGATVEILTFADPEGVDVFRRSSAHLLAHAVVSVFPEARPTIGRSIEDGFYHDFDHPPFDEASLRRIEQRMGQLVEAKLPFRRVEVSHAEARELFGDNPYKVEVIDALAEGEASYYAQGDAFRDLSPGPHVQHTGQIKALRLTRTAATHWRGDPGRPSLQRIYGISFPEARLLAHHEAVLAEQRKRDHRRIGAEMDLFSFQEEAPGFPFWHHKGVVLQGEVLKFWRAEHEALGYEEIRTPMLLDEELWRRSGHYENYADKMYFARLEQRGFAVKPMNCPGGLLIYNTRRHSYRELPLKVAELGLVHRHELTGVLSGLFRVRMFTQDDAHIFCAPDQVEAQVIEVIDLVQRFYAAFDFSEVRVRLSTRPDRWLGDEGQWDEAERILRTALERSGTAFEENPRGGVFYGPKIDFQVRDCIGRYWQCGTIQLDFHMPARFDASYTGADNQPHVPVMIHRAVMGSLERFLGVLIEHYGGKFPLWLAPEQVIVLPVSDRFIDYAREVEAMLRGAGLRARVDARNETLQKLVREAQLARVNYQLVVGERELETRTVSVRTRANRQLGRQSIDAFVARCRDEIESRRAPEGE